MGACEGAGNARRVAPHIFRLAETLLFVTDLVRSLRNFPPRTAHRPKFVPVPLAARGAASGRCYSRTGRSQIWTRLFPSQ